MRPGRANKYVNLFHKPTSASDPKFDNPLNPPRIAAQIQPLEPSFSDDTRGQLSRVTIRYHAQVTLDTHMQWVDRTGRLRTLFVKGVQNVDEDNAEMVLFCEEVIP